MRVGRGNLVIYSKFLSFYSSLLIFHTPDFPHSAFSILPIFHTPLSMILIILTTHLLYSSFSIILIFHTPHFPHSAFRTPHSALRTPHSALRTPHSARRTPYSAFSIQPVRRVKLLNYLLLCYLTTCILSSIYTVTSQSPTFPVLRKYRDHCINTPSKLCQN